MGWDSGQCIQSRTYVRKTIIMHMSAKGSCTYLRNTISWKFHSCYQHQYKAHFKMTLFRSWNAIEWKFLWMMMRDILHHLHHRNLTNLWDNTLLSQRTKPNAKTERERYKGVKRWRVRLRYKRKFKITEKGAIQTTHTNIPMYTIIWGTGHRRK